MQIQSIAFKSANSSSLFEQNRNSSNSSDVPISPYIFAKADESKNNTVKYSVLGLGVLLTGVALFKHKKIGEILSKTFGKESKTNEQIVKEKTEEIVTNLFGGNVNPAEAAASYKERQKVAQAIAEKRRSFPELIAAREEHHSIVQRNKAKIHSEQYDLAYYKDEFRGNVTIPAQRLKSLKESTNPELKEMFDLDRKNFHILEGIMIHGSDRPEKKQLLGHFISEAKKYDMDVVHIQAGGRNPMEIAREISKKLPEAKQKFLTDKKHTMFVIEDADKILNIKDKALSSQNGPCRGSINVHTHECGEEGIMWVSTVKDIRQLDESCYRGGRVAKVIDIDKAVKLSK